MNFAGPEEDRGRPGRRGRELRADVHHRGHADPLIRNGDGILYGDYFTFTEGMNYNLDGQSRPCAFAGSARLV